jgi:NAD(P)-dependent dehydrogenase (short-subunit alcohol dehydrogenase family)
MRLPNTKDQNLGTVVVTGANSGIGYALVVDLLAAGHGVIACDIVTDQLASIDDPGLSVHRLDVADPAGFKAILPEGDIRSDIVGLVACAAVFKRVDFLHLTEALWDQTFAVNLNGSLYACQAVLPLMRRGGRGSIVLMSSSLARSGSPTGAHYAATKGAILGLARSLALEVAEANIRVNVVSPGLTDTPQPRAHAGGVEVMAAKAKSIPLGRIGQPDDMVQAIRFLLSDDSSYVTGQDLRVNGGSQLF